MGGVDLLFLDMIKIIVLGLLSIAVADPTAEAEAYRGYRGYGSYGFRGGYGGYRGFYRGKREAVAMPEAEADAYRVRFGDTEDMEDMDMAGIEDFIVEKEKL